MKIEQFTYNKDGFKSFEPDLTTGKLSEKDNTFFITLTVKDYKNNVTATRAVLTREELRKFRNNLNRLINLL